MATLKVSDDLGNSQELLIISSPDGSISPLKDLPSLLATCPGCGKIIFKSSALPCEGNFYCSLTCGPSEALRDHQRKTSPRSERTLQVAFVNRLGKVVKLYSEVIDHTGEWELLWYENEVLQKEKCLFFSFQDSIESFAQSIMERISLKERENGDKTL